MKLHISEEERRVEVKQTILPFVLWLCLLSIIFVPFRIKVATGNVKPTNFFFSPKRQNNSILFVAFRLLGTIVQTKILFQTIKGTALVNVETFLRADIRLDLTQENVIKVVYWGVGKGTFFYLIGSGRLVPL